MSTLLATNAWPQAASLESLASSAAADTGKSDDDLAILEEQRYGLADVFSILEEQAIVTAGVSRATQVRQAPSSVWVIDERTLETAAAMTLNDYLRTIPGTLTREEGVGQIETNIRFRGSFPEKQVLIVVDGRAVQPDGIGFWDLSHLHVRDVARIELVVGPSSTRYGANAFSGVLSITTKRAARNGTTGTIDLRSGAVFTSDGRTQAPPTAGPLASAHGSVMHGWTTGALRIAASTTYIASSNFEDNVGRRLAPSAFRQGNALVTFEQDVASWKLTLQGMGSIKASPYYLIGARDSVQRDASVMAEATRSGLAGRDDTLTIAAWARYFGINIGASAPVLGDVDAPLQSLMAEARATYVLPTFYRNAMVVGAQVRGALNISEALSTIGARQLLAGVFVEDTFSPIDQLHLTAGLRLDTREMNGVAPFASLALSPRASIVWLLNDKHSLRAEYGAAFRAPAAYERGLNLDFSDGTPLVRGDAKLQNEHTHSVTLGYLGRIGWFAPRLEAFLARTTGNITYSTIAGTAADTEFMGKPLLTVPEEQSPFKLPYYFYNLPGYWIPGAAVKLSFEPTPMWRAFINYSFIPTRVFHTVSIGSELNLSRVSLGVNAYWMDQWAKDASPLFDVASRIILNAQVRVALDRAGHYRLSVAALNLLDIRFFRFRRAEAVALTRDTTSGERIGPRLWAAFDADW